jgi:anti-anti-sigma factor
MFESFKVETHQHGSLWIFSTHGYINNLGGESIAKKFDEVWSNGGRKFIFDLAHSSIINSIGVSYLIEILEKIIESAGELSFCNCAPIIEKTFKIMGLAQYAKIYRTTEDAIEGMRSTVE